MECSRNRMEVAPMAISQGSIRACLPGERSSQISSRGQSILISCTIVLYNTSSRAVPVWRLGICRFAVTCGPVDPGESIVTAPDRFFLRPAGHLHIRLLATGRKYRKRSEPIAAFQHAGIHTAMLYAVE